MLLGIGGWQRRRFLLFSSPLFLSLFCVLPSLSFPFFFSLFLSVSLSLSVSFFFLFFLATLPCFYRQKQGGPTWWGGHCWPPLHHPLIHGKRGKWEEDDGAVQNGTVLGSFSLFFFFLKQCMKRRRFYQNTPFHLNGFGAKTRQI